MVIDDANKQHLIGLNQEDVESTLHRDVVRLVLPFAETVGDFEKGFPLLTVATGGIQLHFRRQKELENAIIGLGDALRSRYFLSYRPNRYDVGFHKVLVRVDIPAATVYARPGYIAAE